MMPAMLPPKTATITQDCNDDAGDAEATRSAGRGLTTFGKPGSDGRDRAEGGGCPGEERGQGQDRQDSEHDGAPCGFLALEHLAENECNDEPEDSERGDDGELLRAR